MKKFFNKKNCFILIICAILLLALTATIIDLIAPSCAFSQWFDSIIPARAIANNLKTQYKTVIKGLIICGLIYSIGYAIRLILAKIMDRSDHAKTVINIFSGFIKYACVIAIIFVILWLCGVNTTALWASAGILTLVIGLGCQSLIADIIAGLFIIFENEFQVGEIVVVSGFRGKVKEIGVRTTKILDAAGDIKIINNSDITDIVNLSRELSLAICECGIEYQDSIERVEHILSENLQRMKENIPEIVDGPFYKGVSELGNSSVVIKLIAQCNEEDRYQVQRSMNRELKLIFDNNNVNIPFPQIVLNQPNDTNADVHPSVKKAAQKFIDEQKTDSKDMEEQQR